MAKKLSFNDGDRYKNDRQSRKGLIKEIKRSMNQPIPPRRTKVQKNKDAIREETMRSAFFHNFESDNALKHYSHDIMMTLKTR